MREQRTRWFGAAALVLGGLLSVAGAGAEAQTSAKPGARWQAWLGCWSAAPTSQTLLTSTATPVVCVTPASGDAVTMATIAEGKVVSSQRIDASGVEQPLDAKGCTGTQRAQWSTDGRRVFVHSVATCGGLKRTTSSLLAFTPAGEWIDVQEISVDSGSAVRVARYRDIGVPSTVPSDIAAALADHSMSAQGARVFAGGPIGTMAVVEANRVSTPAVVEAFILERGERFALDARDLVMLADAGVPGRVTDALVAVSNPDAFAVARRDDRSTRDDAVAPGRRIPVYMEPSYGYYYPYGYGYSNGYGYGYPGYYYGSPVIVVGGTGAKEPVRGRMVKGRGYTATDPGTTASPSTPSTSRGSSSGESAGSSSRGSGESSSGRTAKPRP